MLGRCDDTMNLGGIKVSCIEIEQTLNSVDGVHETAAVALAREGGGPSLLHVYAVLKPGVGVGEDELKGVMQSAIRKRLNPLFQIAAVHTIEALPRTASNKIIRRALRDTK
jgi:acetyl-CoA synthetase